jgi:hypothetical protein
MCVYDKVARIYTKNFDVGFQHPLHTDVKKYETRYVTPSGHNFVERNFQLAGYISTVPYKCYFLRPLTVEKWCGIDLHDHPIKPNRK